MGILKFSKVSIFLVGIMMMANLWCCSSQVQASQSSQDGDYIYTLINGEAQITKYAGTRGIVTIPNILGSFPVTSIGEGAFYGCKDLTNISIPEGVTSIGYKAFCDCAGLTAINIPPSVTRINYGAFFYCTRLNTITIPLEVISIGQYAFSQCTSLTSIRLNSATTTIYDSEYTIPATTKIIGYDPSIAKEYATKYGRAFGVINDDQPINPDYSFTIAGSEAQITKYVGAGGVVTIPSTLGGSPITNIGKGAFKGFIGLTTISIPQGVTSIDEGAFHYCDGLTSIRLNSATTTIYDSEYTIPATTKIIGYDPSIAKEYATKYGRAFEVIGTTNTLQSIAITTPATKLNYNVGDKLDISGLVVIGTYSDGTTEAESLTAANVTGFDSALEATDQVLTITVSGKTVTYKVQIAAAQDITGMTEIGTTTPIVDPSKIWTIKLNGLVNESSINGNVYVTNSKGIKQQITCIAKVVNGLSQIEVKPDKDYTPGDYMLWVKNITDTKGTSIKKQVFLKFTVK